MKIARKLCAAALSFGCLSLLPTTISAAHAADAVPAYVADAIQEGQMPIRVPEDVVRDAARHPEAIFTFAGIKPGTVVADFIAGDGYYTRILSKIVGPKGRIYAIVPMSWRGDFESEIAENKNLVAHGAQPLPSPIDPLLAIQNVRAYANVDALMYQLGSYGGQFSVPEQLDAVFTADHYHELHNPAFAVDDHVAGLTNALFRSLKPGGTYVVIDYAAPKGAGLGKTQTLQRSESDAVKAEILAAGFVLDGQSNALVLAGDDGTTPVTEPAKTSRFALRFKKPANASAETLRPGKGAMDGYYGNTEMSGTKVPSTRWVMYNADGSYLEMGNPGAGAPGRGGDVQVGYWYWDAAGHNCMNHQYPAEERGFIVCHADTGQPFRKVGEVWTLPGSTRDFGLYAGRRYPKAYGLGK
jgi:predicted methyltransferase